MFFITNSRGEVVAADKEMLESIGVTTLYEATEKFSDKSIEIDVQGGSITLNDQQFPCSFGEIITILGDLKVYKVTNESKSVTDEVVDKIISDDIPNKESKPKVTAKIKKVVLKPATATATTAAVATGVAAKDVLDEKENKSDENKNDDVLTVIPREDIGSKITINDSDDEDILEITPLDIDEDDEKIILGSVSDKSEDEDDIDLGTLFKEANSDTSKETESGEDDLIFTDNLDSESKDETSPDELSTEEKSEEEIELDELLVEDEIGSEDNKSSKEEESKEDDIDFNDLLVMDESESKDETSLDELSIEDKSEEEIELDELLVEDEPKEESKEDEIDFDDLEIGDITKEPEDENQNSTEDLSKEEDDIDFDDLLVMDENESKDETSLDELSTEDKSEEEIELDELLIEDEPKEESKEEDDIDFDDLLVMDESESKDETSLDELSTEDKSEEEIELDELLVEDESKEESKEDEIDFDDLEIGDITKEPEDENQNSTEDDLLDMDLLDISDEPSSAKEDTPKNEATEDDLSLDDILSFADDENMSNENENEVDTQDKESDELSLEDEDIDFDDILSLVDEEAPKSPSLTKESENSEEEVIKPEVVESTEKEDKETIHTHAHGGDILTQAGTIEVPLAEIDLDDLAENAAILEIDLDEYKSLLMDFINDAIAMKPTFEGDDIAAIRSQVAVLKDAVTILHLEQLEQQLKAIENSTSTERSESVSVFYHTLDKLAELLNSSTSNTNESESSIDTKESETLDLSMEQSADDTVVESPASTPVAKSSKNVSVDEFLAGVKPLPVEFSLHLAAEELSLPDDLVLEFISDFAQQAHENIPVLIEAYQNGDLDKLQKTAHMLKGAASNLRIEPMVENLYELQYDNDISHAPDRIRLFAGQLMSLDKYLEQQKL